MHAGFGFACFYSIGAKRSRKAGMLSNVGKGNIFVGIGIGIGIVIV